MSRTGLIALILVALLSGCGRPTTSVQGSVFEYFSGGPVPNVKVIAVRNSNIVEEQPYNRRETTTSRDGTFQLRELLPNEGYSLQFSAPGMAFKTDDFLSTPEAGLTKRLENTIGVRCPPQPGVYLCGGGNREFVPLPPCSPQSKFYGRADVQFLAELPEQLPVFSPGTKLVVFGNWPRDRSLIPVTPFPESQIDFNRDGQLETWPSGFYVPITAIAFRNSMERITRRSLAPELLVNWNEFSHLSMADSSRGSLGDLVAVYTTPCRIQPVFETRDLGVYEIAPSKVVPHDVYMLRFSTNSTNTYSFLLRFANRMGEGWQSARNEFQQLVIPHTFQLSVEQKSVRLTHKGELVFHNHEDDFFVFLYPGPDPERFLSNIRTTDDAIPIKVISHNGRSIGVSASPGWISLDQKWLERPGEPEVQIICAEYGTSFVRFLGDQWLLTQLENRGLLPMSTASDASSVSEWPTKPHPKQDRVLIRVGNPNEPNDWTATAVIPDKDDYLVLTFPKLIYSEGVVRLRVGSNPSCSLMRSDVYEKGCLSWVYCGFINEPEVSLNFIVVEGKPVEVTIKQEFPHTPPWYFTAIPGPRGYLGVKHVGAINGAFVVEVASDTPASRAGLRVCDVITHLNGKEVRDGQQLHDLLSEIPPDSKITLKVFRNGDTLLLDAVLSERTGPKGYLGVKHVGAINGAFVVEVASDTPASRAGLRVCDVITHLNGKEVRDGQQLHDLLLEIPPDSKITLKVFRNGDTLLLDAVLSEPTP